MSNETITITTIEILTEDMFGEIERYEMTFYNNDYTYIQHVVFEAFGTCEFNVIKTEKLETSVID